MSPCGRQSCLQAAFQAASWSLAIYRMKSKTQVGQAFSLRRASARLSALALLWGSQSWLQPAFSRLARPLTNFSGFPSRYLQDTKPKKHCDRQCSGFASRLKGGCRHDSLPHVRSNGTNSHPA
jgi:hypothetical protein